MRTRLILALAVCASLVAVAAAGAANWPQRIDLPDGFRPEGIATGKGHELFVGSIPTGAVYRVDAKKGTISEVVAGAPGERAAIGLKADNKGRLFVAGGPTGDGFVYDARSGAELARFAFAPDGAETFVNDVALAKKRAYFTDSRRSVLYVLERDLSGFSELALPDVPLLAGNNLNGIAASKSGRRLLAVQGNVGDLWRIDPRSGDASRVDLGGATLVNGDGLLLHGKRRLYVVQNRFDQIAVVRLSRDWSSGRVTRTITSDGFDVPTTVARIGKRLYLPNARFGTALPDPDAAEYWITQVGARPR